MPGMQDQICKAPVFKRLEDFTWQPDVWNLPDLQTAINRLSNPADDLVQIAIDLHFYTDAAQAAHFSRDWLGRGGGFWPGINTEGIIRAGMLRMCNLIKQYHRPCEIFWVMSGRGAVAEWRMSLAVGRKQITVQFHTPFVQCLVPVVDSKSIWIALVEGGGPISRPAKVPQGDPSIEEPKPIDGSATLQSAERRLKRPPRVKKPPKRPGPGPKKTAKRATKKRRTR